ncbi:AAA-like domain-containing protein [Desulfonema magnum]|uniref:AAA ATPase-like domain-containing protein n=1 Tax=Desulfonema magnum TaxID=45655 RepID=A0A975GMN5_9BACT|nr:AAA-like domain-containing protein [Desulfonema magnum]QTA86939.1 AAA ATPase-like domain-containing protein [Desulfonema magnum]
MRQFSSYGPVDTDLHYYAPRKDLTDKAYMQLRGKNPNKGGHYITVWAPRQAGKTWVMQQVLKKIKKKGEFEVGIISMQSAKTQTSDQGVLRVFVRKLEKWFDRKLPDTDSWENLSELFVGEHFEKPLILIIDEFDALRENFINKFANEFRDMYISRQNQADRPSDKKSCLLHGLALVGVRSVLGIENVTGSSFNVQRTMHIPNLTSGETEGIFTWYERESGQKIDDKVIEQIFCETRGQPGLTCWFGELLTEKYNKYLSDPISMRNFEIVRAAAIKALPNNNILNIISKADREPYKSAVLNMFRTARRTEFSYDDKIQNSLYLNGVIDYEIENETDYFVRFACPLVQKRLFNYFAREMFGYVGKIHEPFEDLSDTLTEKGLNIGNLMRRFQNYLKKNREWLLRDAPRRKDLRIFEAVYHFSLYRYLCDFLGTRDARVWPEFPTGNGKIDIIIEYAGLIYALELKSYTDERQYYEALDQAAQYGRQLGLSEVSLILFVEYVDDANREKYENAYTDKDTGVRVTPVFVETGS